MSVGMCTCVQHMSTSGGERRTSESLEESLQVMWMLEPNCGPQKEHQTLWIAELSIEAQGKDRKTFLCDSKVLCWSVIFFIIFSNIWLNLFPYHNVYVLTHIMIMKSANLTSILKEFLFKHLFCYHFQKHNSTPLTWHSHWPVQTVKGTLFPWLMFCLIYT